VNGALRGFVVAGLAAAGLLVTVPGAEAAQVAPLGVDVAIPVRSSDGHAELFAQLPTRATGVRPGEVVIVDGYHRTVAGRYGDKLAGSVYGRNLMAASQVPDVMPRGGAQDPAKREFDWTPLVILGGLLGTGLGAHLRYSAKRPA
jgi:hypothetical protein